MVPTPNRKATAIPITIEILLKIDSTLAVKLTDLYWQTSGRYCRANIKLRSLAPAVGCRKAGVGGMQRSRCSFKRSDKESVRAFMVRPCSFYRTC